MRDVKVRFGILDDFFGRPGRAEGVTFVPATVELHGDPVPPAHPLHAAVGTRPPTVLEEPLRTAIEAAWVRARIPQVFGFEPEAPPDEVSLLHATFLAVETDSPFAYPFHVSDAGGRAALIFSSVGPDPATQAKIAKAFWAVLLHSPDDLADFATKVLRVDRGHWETIGHHAGKFFRSES